MSEQIFPYILIRTAGLPPFPLSIVWPDEASRQAAETQATGQLQQAFDLALATLPDSPLRTAVYNARKRFFQKKPIPKSTLEQITLAQNAQPDIGEILRCLAAREHVQAQKYLAGETIEQGLSANWRAIQQAAANPDFQKALLFASHDLLDRLPVFCQKPVAEFTAKDRQTGLALLQYLTRGAYKTSPLSRFTTVSVWNWQQRPTPPDPERPAFLQAAKAMVSPNVALLPALYEVLLAEPAFYQSLSLVLNPCVTAQNEAGDRQWLYFDGENESFQQAAFNPAIEAVIRILLAHERLISWPDLLINLQEKISAEETQLADLIKDLVALGLMAWQLPERGLTPGWCGALYNYLGHLPMQPVISEAAALLQWLRTAARTLPFQSVSEAQLTQRQTVRQISAFFEHHGGEGLPIPPEQVFFEDVELPMPPDLPPEIIRQLTEQLARCWRQSAPRRLSPFRSALQAFTAAEMAPGESRPFMDFCKKFLAEKAGWEQYPAAETSLYSGKIGALLQVFKNEDGSFGAVVNGLFAGGGKLMARWWPLFPADFREALQAWFPEDVLAFPWQGWTNANFQPALSGTTLAVPDGRLSGTGEPFLLGNLEVRRGNDGPELVDRRSQRPIRFTDLGLESPATRPPTMQVLWHLGMPAVSLERLWPAESAWESLGGGWFYRPRAVFQSLVLQRASWRVDEKIWRSWLLPSGTPVERLLHLKQAFTRNTQRKHFFVRIYAQKPQYIDPDSVVCWLLLEKMLRGGTGELWCIEMLPDNQQRTGQRVEEFVVELES